MSGWAQRRFWRAARAVEEGAGFGVLLDARPLRTPAKTPLVVPARALAEAIAAEWEALDGAIRPEALPLTRAANTALVRVAPRHAAVVGEVAGYGATDLLCHRAEGPAELAARQARMWDPLLDWAAAALGARLVVTQGVVPVAQPAPALAALRARVAGHDAFALTALHEAVALTGSLVIGLRALAPGADDAALWAASRLDEDWQAEQWGADDEAEAAAAARAAAFATALRFHRLARGEAASGGRVDAT